MPPPAPFFPFFFCPKIQEKQKSYRNASTLLITVQSDSCSVFFCLVRHNQGKMPSAQKALKCEVPSYCSGALKRKVQSSEISVIAKR